jgi:hypothetical protein
MRGQSREERIEQAQELVEYYQRTLKTVGEKWTLGLFMARQWLRIVSEPRPDLEELKLMLRALEAEKDNQGVRWWDLYWRVKVLIEIIEQDAQR